MTDLLTLVLLWVSALGSGLIAGLYYAFSAFSMKALGRIDPSAGMSAMNSINVVILRSTFIPIFFGTTLASLVLAGISIFRWGEPGAPAMLAGGVLYVVGMFVVTMVFNVPLNNALAAADPARPEVAMSGPAICAIGRSGTRYGPSHPSRPPHASSGRLPHASGKRRVLRLRQDQHRVNPLSTARYTRLGFGGLPVHE